ncbi:MAG: hypothetical protein KDC71_23675, partial [Acidobacteria bacterium]|nr:hypothetical protein [Acidobacteriota bacterium]
MQVKADSSTQNQKASTKKKEPYSYAWYLAAIESPDYVDGDNVPGYSEGDYGSFLAMQYAMGNPAYWAITPWSDDVNEPAFTFTGSSVRNNRVSEYYERTLVKKELVYPLLAKTATHTAVFKLDFGRQDALAAHQNSNTKNQFIPAQNIHLDVATAITDDYIHVPAGIGLRATGSVPNSGFQILGLFGNIVDEVEQPDPITFSNCTYKGRSSTGDMDVIQVPGLAGQIANHTFDGKALFYGFFLEDDTNFENTNGSAKLNEIILYDSKTYHALVSLLPSVTLAGETYRDYNFLYKPYSGNQTLLNRYQSRVLFDYGQGANSYDLAKGTPNSKSTYKGRLALKGLKFFAKDGVQGNPGYQFSYWNNNNLKYTQPENKDPWGYASNLSTKLERYVDPGLAGDWSLKQITTPTGAQIDVVYESDFYTRAQQFEVVEYAHLEQAATSTINTWNTNDLLNASLNTFLNQTRYDAEGFETSAFRDAREQFLDNLATPANFNITVPGANNAQDRVSFNATITYQISDTYKTGAPVQKKIKEIFTPVIEKVGSQWTIVTESALNPELVRWADWLHDNRLVMDVANNWNFSGTLHFINREITFQELLSGQQVREAILLPGTVTCPFDGGLEGRDCLPLCDLNGVAIFQTEVSTTNISLPSGVWTQKVLVQARTKIGSKVFQIPLITVAGGHIRMDAEDPEFLRMTNWVYGKFLQAGPFRRYCSPGDVTNVTSFDHNAQLDIAFFPADENDVPLTIQQGGLIGKYGGGIRVRTLGIKDPANAADSFSVEYSYLERSSAGDEILTDRDSGTLFFEPPSIVTSAYGSYGDDRSIRSEEHPYLNFPGGEVVYGCVAIQTVSNELPVAQTVQEFYTAADEIVAQPFSHYTAVSGDYSEFIKAQERTRKGTGSDQIDLTLSRYKYNGSSWSTTPYPGQVSYFIQAPDQKLILDNTGIIGQLKRTTVWDPGASKLLSDTSFEYQAGFDVNSLNSEFLVKKLALSGGQLSDVEPISGLGVHLRQGVDVDQNLAFVLRPVSSLNLNDPGN